MPVHKYDLQSRHTRPDLVESISLELMLSAKTAGAPSPGNREAPDIYIKEGSPPDRLQRVYVVWDEWKNVAENQRTGIIVDAIEKAGPPYDANRIAIAMGLTRREADDLGIMEPGQ